MGPRRIIDRKRPAQQKIGQSNWPNLRNLAATYLAPGALSGIMLPPPFVTPISLGLLHVAHVI